MRDTGLLVFAAVIGFASILLAALASRFFKPELLLPVLALQVTTWQIQATAEAAPSLSIVFSTSPRHFTQAHSELSRFE
jgi:hypothetical protein